MKKCYKRGLLVQIVGLKGCRGGGMGGKEGGRGPKKHWRSTPKFCSFCKSVVEQPRLTGSVKKFHNNTMLTR